MTSLQGHFLISGRELVDPNFFRSVVFLLQHNDDGAMGLIVNRPTETTIVEAWEQVFDTECACDGVLHQGGPCEGPLMVLHNETSIGQMDVIPGVSLATDKDDIKWLIEKPASPMKFFVGYAGWSAGQLESELACDSWLVTKAQAEQVFNTDQGQWDDLTKRIGRAAMFQSLNIRHVPEDPSVN